MKTPFPVLQHPISEARSEEELETWLPEVLSQCPESVATERSSEVFEEYVAPVDRDKKSIVDWEKARREVEAAITEAKVQAEKIREQAWQQGYCSGQAQAEKEMWAALTAFTQEMRQQTEKWMQALIEEEQKYFAGLEDQMLDLTLQIARKVVKDEVKQNPETIRNIIRDALRRVQGFGMVRIKVHPHDLASARAARASFLNIVEGIQGIEITEDRRVEQGSCIIETEHGTIDARLSIQMEEVERVLKSA